MRINISKYFLFILLVPIKAMSQAIPGWVDVTINNEGKAEKIVLVQPNLQPEMAKPIENTISQWTFIPGVTNGQTVPRTTSLAILISLVSTENGSNIIVTKISEGPRILNKADTTCLNEAKKKGIQGTVSLKYTVNSDGTVSNLSTVKSTVNTALESCIKNVTQNTVFKSDTLNGVPIQTEVERDFVIK